MSFKPKDDVYGIAVENILVIKNTNGGETATNVEAVGQDGSIVANEVIGLVANPSCDCDLKGTLTRTAGQWKLGSVSTFQSKCYALESISITTAGGSAPTISVSGKQVQDGATAECTYSIPAFSLTTRHHAQILFNEFTLSGAGCHLTGTGYTISGTVNVVTKDAVPIAFDIVQGKIVVQVTIKQCGSTKPTLTAAEGWSITAPLAESNQDAEYATYTATLTKYLAKDAHS